MHSKHHLNSKRGRKTRPLPVLPLRRSTPADSARPLYLAACRSRYLRGKRSSQCTQASSWTTTPTGQRETSSWPGPAPERRGPAFGTPLGSCKSVRCAVRLARLLLLRAARGDDPWGRCVAASWSGFLCSTRGSLLLLPPCYPVACQPLTFALGGSRQAPAGAVSSVTTLQRYAPWLSLQPLVRRRG